MTPREELLEMLRYKRPARSHAERKFINRFLMPLPGYRQDDFGNVIIKVGTSPILWSSHTDTVHLRDGKQDVLVDKEDFAHVNGLDCLGADCTTGVWLMVNMIRANVPGLYVFHRDEECGGRGSSHIADKTPELLDGIKFAIAFDRKKVTSIVTHQFGQRCCSDEFVKSLDLALGGGWKGDDTGTFTDTANYTDLVPECTNISVGYYDQHTHLECQDIPFALALLKTMIEGDFTQLAEARDPKAAAADDDQWWTKYRSFGVYSTSGREEPDMDDVPFPTSKSKGGSRYDQLKDLVLEHPEVVADLLDQCGITPDEILKSVYGPH